jgi:hypothetical protein
MVRDDPAGVGSPRMVYVYVFLGALATGGLVFWLTLRATPAEPGAAPTDGDGLLPGAAPGATPAEGVYVPITRDRRSWQTRLAGFLGIVILVAFASAMLAFGLYQAGAFVARVLSNYAS